MDQLNEIIARLGAHCGPGLRVLGLGFRVWALGLGSRVQGLGFIGFCVQGLGLQLVYVLKV